MGLCPTMQLSEEADLSFNLSRSPRQAGRSPWAVYLNKRAFPSQDVLVLTSCPRNNQAKELTTAFCSVL